MPEINCPLCGEKMKKTQPSVYQCQNEACNGGTFIDAQRLCPACETEMIINEHGVYECQNEACKGIFIEDDVKKSIFGVK